MNSRGQAALEYLMTYGWALIVIAIVVGVLVFIVATPTNTLNCTSNQPGKLNVVSNNIRTCGVSGTSIGDIVLTNMTGGQASFVDINGTGFFSADPVTGYTTSNGTLPIGSNTLAVLASATSGSTATLVVGYNDSVGLRQNLTITCQGTAVTIKASCP